MLEGGSIDVNGAGLLLTTEECLLSETVQVRNPGLGRADLEQYFADYLGIHPTIWLKRGIAGDDTHGHIDDLARFVDENTIVTVTELDKSEANYEPLQENLELLQQTGLRIATLPMPAPVYFDGQRLPASYANFYIANKLVLVPTFNDPMDRVALNKLAALFPSREVVGIHCRDLVLGLGTLHCMTMQQPAAGTLTVTMRFLDLATIAIYLIAITWFGAHFRKSQHNLKDYFLGGRTAPWWAIALSIVSAETSTLTVIGTPALSFHREFPVSSIGPRIPARAHRDLRLVSAAIFSRRNVHGL